MSTERPSQKLAVCACNNCSDQIEFDPADSGATIQCPHCGLDTLLFIPQVAPGSKRAKIVEHTSNTGGVEGQLEQVGSFLLALGAAVAFVALLVALFLLNQEGGATLTWFIIAAVAVVQGVVLYVLFKAGAEIIRLLKKSVGLKFSGQISQPTPSVATYTCSACGQPVDPNSKRCLGCGAQFDA